MSPLDRFADVRARVEVLFREDLRGAVWCAGLCASTVLPWMSLPHARPALRLVGLWAQGVPVSASRLRKEGQYRRLLGFIASQAAPLSHPGVSPLGDWLLERGSRPRRVGTLGASLTWARAHRLRWWVPAQRWAAEHRILPPPALVRGRL
ncbi:MAG: hypothetical protein AAGA48_19535 [Myxococcota bacterium]